MASKKFSLESILSLTDGITAPMAKIQTKMMGFSKTMQKNFGGVGKSINAMSKGIDRAAIAFGAVAAAGTAAAVAIVQSTASSADAFIKQARMIGITTEELQALTYAADLQGVSSETLNTSLEKMMRTMGELRNGQGALAKYLEGTDRALLKQLQTASSTEEAFTLLMGKLSSMPDEFSRAQFAQLAFGRSGMDMIKMASGGEEAIAGLLAEAHRYGVISTEASEASESYLDNLARLKAMLMGLKNQVFSALIPKLSAVVEAFVKLFDETRPGASIVDRLSEAIDNIDIASVIQGLKKFWTWISKTSKIVIDFIKFLAPLAPMLLTLVVAIKAVSIAMAIYNFVMLANPTTWIIAGIIALIAVIVLVISYWDEIVAVLKKVWEWMKMVAMIIWDALVSAFNAVIEVGIQMWEVIRQIGQAFMSFLLAPINMVIDAIQGLLNVISKIPGIGGKLKPAVDALQGFQGGMNELLTGKAEPIYASPSTYGAESRSYSETRSISEVFVRPERGATISTTPGGPAQPALFYGRNQ